MLNLSGYTLTEIIHDSVDRVVYRGYRDRDSLPIVAKACKGEYPSPRDLALLSHEHSILSTLTIPGVVRTYGLASYRERFALILERIPAPPLNQTLLLGALELKVVLQIACALADTLASLHQQHVIHKDIKPHNILFEAKTGKVVLIDFGIATRLSQETQSAAAPDSLEGTLAYMSPEQTGRVNRVIDHRTDLYSLGVTLYEMLTGELPFKSAEPMELVHHHIARVATSPHQLKSSVPKALSDLVMKLLAKSPEDRYRNARGLLVDLEECRAQYLATGTIAPFALGRRDISETLQIPQKLYGREPHVAALLTAFERVSRGRSELILLAGPPGAGKSALASELHQGLAQRGGDFITGKFELLHRTMPFSAFTQAFRGLLHHVLSQPAARLAEWRQNLMHALAPNAKLLTDLMPELELVIGPQPPAATLAPAEAQNRFGMLMQRFVRLFSTAKHPLVLFLDDLQWADPASFWLLRLLLTDPESGYLLVVAAYRDSEVDAAHPLRALVQTLHQQGVDSTDLALGPLELQSVRKLLAETLIVATEQQLDSLSALVFAKTHGNPFFTVQFLLALEQAKLLRLDPALGRWVWEEELIAAAPITDNVVELMAGKIRQQPADTQRLLALAACIGNQFDLTTLAVIAESSRVAAATQLWPALSDGLVQPTSGDYRLMSGPGTRERLAMLEDAGKNVGYRFLHDRVQQAAYAQIPEAEQASAHLRIGRQLRERLPSERRAAFLFDVVQHLNAGAGLISDEEERLDLARLNLDAGRTAKAATAYAAAADYFRAGAALIELGAKESAYELAFTLGNEHAECSYLAGQFAPAEAALDQLLQRARTDLQRAELLGLRMRLYTSQGRFQEGSQAGLAGLKMLGIELPSTPQQCQEAFFAEVMAIDQQLAGRPIQSALDAPAMTAADKQAALRLMMELSPILYQLAPLLGALVIAKQVHFSLLYGHGPLAPYGYVTYGLILAGLLGRHADAIEYGRLALCLVERFSATELACKVHFQFGMYAPFGEPMRASLKSFLSAQQVGMETGDLFYASLGFSYYPLTQLRLGESLESIAAEVTRGLSAMKRTQDGMNTAALQLIRQMVAALRGKTRGQTLLSDAEFDETQWLARVDAMGFTSGRCIYHLCKLQLGYLHEDYKSAYENAEQAEQSVSSSLGMHWTTDIAFYAGLTLAALSREAKEELPPSGRAALERHAAALASYAKSYSGNEQHRHLLLSAELARLADQHGDAMRLYDEAIATATSNGFLHHAALANELCAKYHLAHGRTKVAAVYMADAHYGYERWGALAKTSQLLRQYPDLLRESRSFMDSRESRTGSGLPAVADTSMTTWMPGQHLDVLSVLKAAQTISSEIDLDKVLDRVMRIVVRSAGAQRGFLILSREDSLWVEAQIEIAPERVEVGVHSPVSARSDLAASVVHFVAQSRELVVLNDASRDPRFALDPYVVSARLKSVLGLALLNQGRLAGVLYLENNITTGAFTQERVALLRSLSTQAAISVENALLYSNLKTATEKLREANETLEQQVVQRTAELSQALSDVWSEMDLARKIQTVLLPSEARLDGYELTAVMRPAAKVGGDYYDIFPIAGADWLFIGDVSGHGISAGLCMMMVQTAVRAVVQTLEREPAALRPAEVLALVNAAVYRNLSRIGRDHYMTITAFSFHGDTVRYSGLHQDILIYRAAQRRVERVETHGAWLGVLPSLAGLLREDTLQMSPGDVMLLFTDGVTEARVAKRKFLQTDGLSAVFAELVEGATTSFLVQKIMERIQNYVIKDDITVIALKRNGEAVASHE